VVVQYDAGFRNSTWFLRIRIFGFRWIRTGSSRFGGGFYKGRIWRRFIRIGWFFGTGWLSGDTGSAGFSGGFQAFEGIGSVFRTWIGWLSGIPDLYLFKQDEK
jgi:hypothetical protein